jgi:uncharacterized protein YjbI with pentapeptide repeats
MPKPKTTPAFPRPLPPETPSEPVLGEHSAVFGADLTGQVGEHLHVTRCELHRVVLTGAHLRGLSLVDVLAVDCELSGAFLHEASLRRVELRNCRMGGVVLSQSRLNHVRFVDCKLDEANLRLVQADHVELSDCSLVDADLYEARLTKSALDRCDLRGCDFSKASVKGLRLAGSRLDGVRGGMSMGGVVITGDQVLPLALSVFGDLRIKIQNDEG